MAITLITPKTIIMVTILLNALSLIKPPHILGIANDRKNTNAKIANPTVKKRTDEITRENLRFLCSLTFFLSDLINLTRDTTNQTAAAGGPINNTI